MGNTKVTTIFRKQDQRFIKDIVVDGSLKPIGSIIGIWTGASVRLRYRSAHVVEELDDIPKPLLSTRAGNKAARDHASIPCSAFIPC